MALTFNTFSDTLGIVSTELQEYYTTPQAAKVLGIGRMTAFRWVNSGKIQTKMVAGMRLIPGSEIARIMKEKGTNDA